MPLYGLGNDEKVTTNNTKYALNKANIQLIETAQFYENEKKLGCPFACFPMHNIFYLFI